MSDEETGRRAVFSQPSPSSHPSQPASTPPDAPPPRMTPPRDGKMMLFASAVRRPGTLVLECSTCHGKTRLNYVEFVQRHLPFWLWTPWREYSRYMVCPACGQRTWVKAHWLK